MATKTLPAWATKGAKVTAVNYARWGNGVTVKEGTITRTTKTSAFVTYAGSSREVRFVPSRYVDFRTLEEYGYADSHYSGASLMPQDCPEADTARAKGRVSRAAAKVKEYANNWTPTVGDTAGYRAALAEFEVAFAEAEAADARREAWYADCTHNRDCKAADDHHQRGCYAQTIADRAR